MNRLIVVAGSKGSGKTSLINRLKDEGDFATYVGTWDRIRTTLMRGNKVFIECDEDNIEFLKDNEHFKDIAAVVGVTFIALRNLRPIK